MTGLEPKKLPTTADFFACPIWRYDDEDDLYHPVLSEEQIPEWERDLSIRAIFTTPKGQQLDGYVVGISRVFSIGLFGREKFFHANKNLKNLSEEQMQAFLAQRSDLGVESPTDIFPLKYMTQIHREGYRDFSGTFDLYDV